MLLETRDFYLTSIASALEKAEDADAAGDDDLASRELRRATRIERQLLFYETRDNLRNPFRKETPLCPTHLK